MCLHHCVTTMCSLTPMSFHHCGLSAVPRRAGGSAAVTLPPPSALQALHQTGTASVAASKRRGETPSGGQVLWAGRLCVPLAVPGAERAESDVHFAWAGCGSGAGTARMVGACWHPVGQHVAAHEVAGPGRSVKGANLKHKQQQEQRHPFLIASHKVASARFASTPSTPWRVHSQERVTRQQTCPARSLPAPFSAFERSSQAL